MRRIGRQPSAIDVLPSAEGLRQAARHMNTSVALAAVRSTGIAKGVYRFRTRDEADAQVLEGLARVVAANAAIRRRGS
jgi:hypothetical protein